MKTRLILCGLFCMWATLAFAQTVPDAQSSPGSSSSAQTANPAAQPQSDSPAAQRVSSPAIPATLSKTVDSKKVKAGDPIEAKTAIGLTSGNGVRIPAGTKIVGHIKDAKAKSKGDPESAIAFSFEKMILKNGQEIPFPSVAQAIGAQSNANDNSAAAFPESAGPNAQARSNGPGASGAPAATSTPAGASPASPEGSAGVSQGTMGASTGNSPLPQNATGVVGIKGLTLNSQAAESTISSDSKSVKLEEGTQLLLRSTPQ